jgi:hypothetical protein
MLVFIIFISFIWHPWLMTKWHGCPIVITMIKKWLQIIWYEHRQSYANLPTTYVHTYLFIHPPIYQPTYLLTHQTKPPTYHLVTYLFTYPPTHLLTYYPLKSTYLLTYPPTHLLPYLLTYLPSHAPTHPPTYLLPIFPPICLPTHTWPI